LVYPDVGHSCWILKITDSGLSVNLSNTIRWESDSKSKSSPWAYDAPEFRRAYQSTSTITPATAEQTRLQNDKALPSTSEVPSNDVWKMGCVFVELEAFLLCGGPAGITHFRDHITTTIEMGLASLETDTFGDYRFDDGENVKSEVLEWIDELSTTHFWASQLSIVLRRMLCPYIERWSAREVALKLLEVLTQ
jgi:serine/threonine protein kinase